MPQHFRWTALTFLPALVLWSAPAQAVIVQDPGATAPAAAAALAPLPSTGAFGRWGGNAGAVAIASNWAITSRHQDVADATKPVVFGGVTYTVAEQVIIGQDQRLVRLVDGAGADANLPFVPLACDPLTLGESVLIAGFGPGIGAADPGGNGYALSGSLNNANPLRMGLNHIDAVGTLPPADPDYPSMAVIVADFDDGTSGTPPMESTVNVGDSGGGWMVVEAGQWALAGITFSVAFPEPGSGDPDAFFGQQLLASDMQPFKATILATIPEPSVGLWMVGGAMALGFRRRVRQR